ncbi:AbrB/MazE/SpoVT family DNA-binding domain-containing protein (plasmid) [Pontibacillus sp. ALD_SL1]|uniref:AbrB/MazE/SpoVT family DNA-binding domain-containing protein n=1 Tax=Pontibacillus sp. ALD_SL1 TaxID=2777185 RepID=UPI001A959FED|nr:AbrB/MazE/SpoVT family DNA-binding domain-containing protein [Pontibacillus sp. ALD_SL1]QST02753.1 AbrB/MazE/SpoVT family DNA-binding domain-containing protein [Pontibacillus sp. ALD_SL1]
MKATGVVRRIDDLGRVVIPKEIRRSYRIKEGDSLEIFTNKGEVVLKKYAPIVEIEAYAQGVTDSLYDVFHNTVLVTDERDVVAVSGDSKKAWTSKKADELLSWIENWDEESVEQSGENAHLSIPIHDSEKRIGNLILLPSTHKLNDEMLQNARMQVKFLERLFAD